MSYSEETNQTEVEAIYSHPDQVLSLDISPHDANLTATFRQSETCAKVISIYRLLNPYEADSSQNNERTSYTSSSSDRLEPTELVSFAHSSQITAAVGVNGLRFSTSNESLLLVADCKHISLWNIDHADSKSSASVSDHIPL